MPSYLQIENISKSYGPKVLFENIAFNINEGDKIALIGKNTSKWVTVMISAMTYGATIVPILQEFNPFDVQHIVNHSEAVILFCTKAI